MRDRDEGVWAVAAGAQPAPEAKSDHHGHGRGWWGQTPAGHPRETTPRTAHRVPPTITVVGVLDPPPDLPVILGPIYTNQTCNIPTTTTN